MWILSIYCGNLGNFNDVYYATAAVLIRAGLQRAVDGG
jgi:hypothetical protein